MRNEKTKPRHPGQFYLNTINNCKRVRNDVVLVSFETTIFFFLIRGKGFRLTGLAKQQCGATTETNDSIVSVDEKQRFYWLTPNKCSSIVSTVRSFQWLLVLRRATVRTQHTLT